MLGKEVRMQRLFNRKPGKILVIATDHAIGWGVIPGIDAIKAVMEKIVRGRPGRHNHDQRHRPEGVSSLCRRDTFHNEVHLVFAVSTGL